MIFVDTNVVSETLRRAPNKRVIDWLIEHDAEVALPTVTIAEVAYGIDRIRPDQRATRLAAGLSEWRRRFDDRIFGFSEEAALAYGELMGEAERRGATMSVPDGLIAAITRVNGGTLATRNVSDFQTTGLRCVNPWD